MVPVSGDPAPEELLARILTVQCRLAPAVAGAVLRIADGGRAAALACYPPGDRSSPAMTWLGRAIDAATQAIKNRSVVAVPLPTADDLYGQPAGRHVVAVPLQAASDGTGVVAVFLAAACEGQALAACQERLALSAGLLSVYEVTQASRRQELDLRRLRTAMETLAAANEPERFKAAAMGLCNEVATRWQCDRVSLGVLKGRSVTLKAMSHTEKFSRKMSVVQGVEAAMEECLDQDIEVSCPPAQDSVCVGRAAEHLATHHGQNSVLSLPLRAAGKPQAVLTLERPAIRPFGLEEVETLRLTCDLCAARLLSLETHDRWIGARAAIRTRQGLALLVGPKHTWIKLLAIGLLGLLLFAFLGRGEYQAEATFVLEPTTRQVLPAPFDGYLKTVSVTPGDPVVAGKTVLATMETAELQLQLAEARAEQATHLKRAAMAMREGKTAEAQAAKAEADRVAARMDLLAYRITRSSIVSPIDGVVASGDLKRNLGAPVNKGDMLFEVVPLELLRADLLVPDSEIVEVYEGQEQGGELATAAYPDQRTSFVVERVTPVAEVVKGQNVFRVRARLVTTESWMRPGMEGVARVSLGRRCYAWLWTRHMTNWLRMKFWL